MTPAKRPRAAPPEGGHTHARTHDAAATRTTPVALTHHALHVWLVHPGEFEGDPVVKRYETLLTAADRERRDRLLRAEGRRDFTITRALLRTTLSRYADVPPERWAFRVGEHGKPSIDEPREFRWLTFNLSHTAGLIACAVGRDLEVGIDVENNARARRTTQVADRFFAPAEVAALRALSRQAQSKRFFCYWTLKEAYIKARGLGLAIPLGSFAFDLSRRPVAIDFDEPSDDDAAAWQFGLWQPTRKHTAAWAARVGRDQAATFHCWDVVPLRSSEDSVQRGG